MKQADIYIYILETQKRMSTAKDHFQQIIPV